MTWVSLALALLKFVNGIMNWANERRLIDQGHREAVLEASMAIANKVADRKAIQEKIDAMSDADVDDALSKRGA